MEALPRASFALLAAVLFGASTPFAKGLLGTVDPVVLAGLLYLGAGLGLVVWRWLRIRRDGDRQEATLALADLPWLAGAIVAGGVVGPRLADTPASSASLLLNLEGVFTAILAWCVFHEHCDRRIVLGMGTIVAGSLVLSWEGRPQGDAPWHMIAIVGACLAWAIDNNLTRKVSAADPVQIVGAKGVIAGVVNLLLAVATGAARPDASTTIAAMLVGFFGYGISLVFYVLSLRSIGTARTGAYFSLAPFIGAVLSLFAFAENPSGMFLIAAVFMGTGVWLHLTEQHQHRHGHEPLEHEHSHIHDPHHQHGHGSEEPHSHSHVHEHVFHSHMHYPDIHHRHEHKRE
jgi:drug/metabolite transporter (DMT)-like permease